MEGFGNHIDATAPPQKTVRRGGACMPWTMYKRAGQRKYLTKSETQLFLRAAETHNELVHSFCWVIAVTGCRISEALALTEKNIDFEAQHIVIHSLKKRGKLVYRAIPVPSNLLNRL